MSLSTKGQIEAEVAAAAARLQREQHGRGPKDVRVSLIGDALLIRSVGIFTAIEEKLLSTEEGQGLVRSARRELRSISRQSVEAVVADITEACILRSYYDVDVAASEQVELFVLDQDVEKRLLRAELNAFKDQAPRKMR